jgi:hypothetical protein
MEPDRYNDPLQEAFNHGSQRVAQFASLVGAMAQVVIQRRALHDARNSARTDEHATRILDEQERLIHRQSRLSWAPAHDSQWLAQADLIQTGRAWAGAASYADTDPAAASAMRKCEERLRKLHPYAMARYDRLRDDGANPLDAMRESAPLFSRTPNVRVGDPAPARPALSASTGQETSPSADQAPGSMAERDADAAFEPVSEDRAEQRARQIIYRLQAGAGAANRPELGSDELAMVLEAVTNLPEDVIERLTHQAANEARARSEGQHAAHRSIDPALDMATTAAVGERTIALTAANRDASNAHAAHAAQTHLRTDRTAAQLAAQSFPRTASDAVRAAASTARRYPARTPVRASAPEIAERPGRKL